jgi:hypothetical protein
MPEMLPLCTCTCGCGGARCRVAGVGIQPGLGQSQLRSGCGEREREARQREADRACAASALTTTTHPSATLHSLSPAHTPRTQGVARLASKGRAKPTFARSPPPHTHRFSLSLFLCLAPQLAQGGSHLTLLLPHAAARLSLSLSLSLVRERRPKCRLLRRKSCLPTRRLRQAPLARCVLLLCGRGAPRAGAGRWAGLAFAGGAGGRRGGNMPRRDPSSTGRRARGRRNPLPMVAKQRVTAERGAQARSATPFPPRHPYRPGLALRACAPAPRPLRDWARDPFCPPC